MIPAELKLPENFNRAAAWQKKILRRRGHFDLTLQEKRETLHALVADGKLFPSNENELENMVHTAALNACKNLEGYDTHPHAFFHMHLKFEPERLHRIGDRKRGRE